MAKKNAQLRKNSRAARQAAEQPEMEVDAVPMMDAKTRVLNELAEKEKRKGSKMSAKMDELTAITKGLHPDQPKKATNIHSSNSKAHKRKVEKARMVQEMLAEKVANAKKRHKVVRSYREDSD